ncbi:MAG TPA: 6-bladed beta-propeller [Longimicrobiales bacterium]|nr:6-bladed beta-propeller [Longimicrobiales bacterium]
MCTALLLALAGCGGRSGGPPTQRLQRRVVEARWQPAFEIRSGADDTTFQYLASVALGVDRVYALDVYAHRILAFDSVGNRLWTFGRKGDGPGEFRNPQEIRVDAQGRIWVLDPDAARLSILDRAGALLRTLPLDRLPGRPDSFLPLGGDSVVIAISSEPRPFWILDAQGNVLARLAFPGSGFRRIDPFARQLWLGGAPVTRNWAAGLALADGFVTFNGPTQLAHGWYAEAVKPPAVVRHKSDEGGRTVQVTELAAPPTPAAQALAVTDSTVLVLFAGHTEQRSRIIDIFDLRTGAYRATIRLPWAEASMASFRNRFAFFSNRPVPDLRVGRLRTLREGS